MPVAAPAREPYHIKLYNLPQRVEGGIKLYGLEPEGDKDGVVIFDHLDGMYSYCYVEGQEDKVIHLSASTPLVEYKDGYMVEAEPEEAK